MSDLRCPNCNYDLCGSLTPGVDAARCPECGKSCTRKQATVVEGMFEAGPVWWFALFIPPIIIIAIAFYFRRDLPGHDVFFCGGVLALPLYYFVISLYGFHDRGDTVARYIAVFWTTVLLTAANWFVMYTCLIPIIGSA